MQPDEILSPPAGRSWAPHEAVWIGWPSAADLWEENLGPAQGEVAELIGAICFPDPGDEKGEKVRGERVELLVRGEEARVAAEAMRLGLPDPTMVRLHEAAIGDVWLRDTGPIFVDDGALGISASASERLRREPGARYFFFANQSASICA